MKKITILALLTGILFSVNMLAQVPQTINYQGVLNDANGLPVNDTKFMEFRMYNQAVGGTLIWSEQHINVEITDGLFAVTLGETEAFAINDFQGYPEQYITFVVGGEEMLPRQKLNAVPFSIRSVIADEANLADEANYSFYAENAGQLDGISSEFFVQQDASENAIIAGTMSAMAFIGDGSALTNLPPSPDNDWTENGNYVYTLTDSVGIGTANPTAPLEVYGHIYQSNIGGSVFLGQRAGENDDLSNNRNVFIGYETGIANTSGYWNNIIGTQSFSANETGRQNNALGYRALQNNVDGQGNTAIGGSVLYLNTSGNYNIGIGNYAAYNNTTGENNTAIGAQSLYNNTSGYSNIAIGPKSLYNSTNRSNLIAIGDSALFNNGLGASESYEATKNTAIGSNSLFSNTIGYYNTATGYHSLYANTTGIYNTAIGTEALYANTTGDVNTAAGTQALHANTIGMSNSAFGNRALYNNTTGDENTASGLLALANNESGNSNSAHGYRCLQNNTTGDNNTAIGIQALNYNSTGNSNVAIGVNALYKNTDRSNSVAIGDSALFNNGTGATYTSHSIQNTAIGSKALYTNTTGYSNTAIGFEAMYSNTDDRESVGIGVYALKSSSSSFSVAIGNEALMNADRDELTACGYNALKENTTGEYNAAFGARSLNNNTEGSNNTAIGTRAMNINTTGAGNTALGCEALEWNSSGSSNCVIGYRAMRLNSNGSSNTAIGNHAMFGFSNGDYNTAVGKSAYYGDPYNPYYYDNSTAIGYYADITYNNQVRIGNSSVTSIGGYASWSNLSDGRFKQNVQENVPGLDFILQLRPVTYNLDIDKLNDFQNVPDSVQNISKLKTYGNEKAAIQYTGFIAQEVEEVADKLGFDFSGVDKPQNKESHYSLRYAEFVVPLVQAMKEQQAIIEQQNDLIEEL